MDSDWRVTGQPGPVAFRLHYPAYANCIINDCYKIETSIISFWQAGFMYPFKLTMKEKRQRPPRNDCLDLTVPARMHPRGPTINKSMGGLCLWNEETYGDAK